MAVRCVSLFGAVTGDLEFLANELHYPHFNAVRPCWLCGVTRDDRNACKLFDFRADAPWKGTLISTEEGLVSPCPGHPLSLLRAFTRFHTTGDLMHTGALGVLLWFLGSVLKQLVVDSAIPGTPDDRLKTVWVMILEKYDALGFRSRLTRLARTMFDHGDKQYPCLTTKAAETIDLLYALRSICTDLNGNSPRDLHRLACFDGLVCIFDTCKAHGYTLPPAASGAVLAACDRFLLHYNWLAKEAMSQGRVEDNMVVKLHMLWHICYFSKYLNPRCTWCFAFEDYVGRVIASAKSCMASSRLALVPRKILENWHLVMHLRLRN